MRQCIHGVSDFHVSLSSSNASIVPVVPFQVYRQVCSLPGCADASGRGLNFFGFSHAFRLVLAHLQAAGSSTTLPVCTFCDLLHVNLVDCVNIHTPGSFEC
jgi:hypothetical protein